MNPYSICFQIYYNIEDRICDNIFSYCHDLQNTIKINENKQFILK
jgi:hypothetical protein